MVLVVGGQVVALEGDRVALQANDALTGRRSSHLPQDVDQASGLDSSVQELG